MARKKKQEPSRAVDPAVVDQMVGAANESIGAGPVAPALPPPSDVPADGPQLTAPSPPAAGPEESVTMYAPDGTPVQVPHSQAQQKFIAGELGFSKDQTIHVKNAAGKVFSVAGAEAGQVLNAGDLSLASSTDLAESKERKEYGGFVKGAEAFATGVGSGLTFGLSDVAARKLGAGDEFARLKKHHSIAHAAGNVLGAVAPIIATGGAGAGAEGAALGAEGVAAGAELARGAEAAGGLGSALATGVRTAGVLPRGVAALGSAAGRAAEGVVGTGATSFAGRLAQKAIPMAVQGGVEGAAYGAGAELSEEALGDHELNAEKLLAGAKHGALWGAAAGGVLGAGEVAARAIGEKAFKIVGAEGLEDWLNTTANNRLFKQVGGDRAAVNALGKGAARPAEQAAERIQEMGNTIRDYHFSDGERLFKGAASTEELGERLAKAVDEQSERLAAVRERAYKVTGERPELAPDVQGFLGKVDSVAEQIASKGLTSDLKLAAKLQEEFAPLRAKVAPPELPPQLAELKAASPEAFDKLVAANPELAAKLEPAGSSLEELVALRKRLDEKIYKAKAGGGVQAPEVSEMADALHEVRAHLEATIEEATTKAAEATGDASLIGDLKDAKDKLHNLIPARDIAAKWTNAELTRRVVSPSDYGTGLAAFAGSLAHGVGGLGSAAMGAATSAAHHFIRERGSGLVAAAADKLAALAAVQRATGAIDAKIDAGVASLFSARPVSSRASAAAAFMTSRGKDRDRVFEQRAAEMKDMAVNPAAHFQHLATFVSPIAQHAPLTASAVASKTSSVIQAINAKMPKSEPREGSIQPQLDERRVSEADKDKAARYAAAAIDPTSIFDDIRAGRLSRDAIQAVRDNYPKLYTQIRTKVIEKCATSGKAVSYETRIQLGTLFGFPADPTQTPAFRASMQQMYKATAPKPAAASQNAPHMSRASMGGPSRPLKVAENRGSALNRLMDSHFPN